MGDPAFVNAIDRTNRNLTKTLIGDFILDRELAQHRGQLFLPRNMTRVLAFHEKARMKKLKEAEKSRRASPRGIASPSASNNPAASSKDAAPVVNGTIRSSTGQSGLLSESKNANIEKPAIEAMSQSCLAAKIKNNEYVPPARRSIRRAQDQPYQNQDAELRITLCNIRKKLNFKSNILAENERSSKRLKSESIRCQCHLTVWDNRDGLSEAEPIIRKSEVGHVTAINTGPNGYFVDVELEEPFYIKASELKVTTSHRDETTLSLVDKYFLEIKIIPTRSDVEWPPIPLLGKSDGDHFPGLGKSASEKLQGSLVARYMHLPQAPVGDVPLSIFFLHQSRTFRTKYGLEVDSEWAIQTTPRPRVKKEPELEPETQPWAFDDKKNLFGRILTASAEKPALVLPPEKPPEPEPPEYLTAKVNYTFEDANSTTVPKEFRKSVVEGMYCPICSGQSYKTLSLLEFHLTHTHHKYKFIIEEEKYDRATNKLSSVSVKVRPTEPARPKPPDKVKHEKEMDWQAPVVPLDLPAYLNGDHTWLGTNKKKPTQTAPTVHIQRDENSILRKQHGGFLKADAVRKFRKANRKKYPIIKLRTATEEKQVMYTSISHRPLHLSEEPLSETDDEMEDEWFIGRHLEHLDINASRANWSKPKRELYKRWDRHRLEEQLEHPRFLSDSLVRFVYKHQTWLQTNGTEFTICFYDFLNQLKRLRVIDDEVIIGLHGLPFPKSSTGTSGSILTPPIKTQGVHLDQLRRQQTSPPTSYLNQYTPRPNMLQATRGLLAPELLLSLPSVICGMCLDVILNPILETIYCAHPSCSSPGVAYHYLCVNQKRDARFSGTYHCLTCVARARKERENLPVSTTMASNTLLSRPGTSSSNGVGSTTNNSNVNNGANMNMINRNRAAMAMGLQRSYAFSSSGLGFSLGFGPGSLHSQHQHQHHNHGHSPGQSLTNGNAHGQGYNQTNGNAQHGSGGTGHGHPNQPQRLQGFVSTSPALGVSYARNMNDDRNNGKGRAF